MEDLGVDGKSIIVNGDEKERKNVECINLVQDTLKGRAVVKTGMNFGFHKMWRGNDSL